MFYSAMSCFLFHCKCCTLCCYFIIDLIIVVYFPRPVLLHQFHMFPNSLLGQLFLHIFLVLIWTTGYVFFFFCLQVPTCTFYYLVLFHQSLLVLKKDDICQLSTDNQDFLAILLHSCPFEIL